MQRSQRAFLWGKALRNTLRNCPVPYVLLFCWLCFLIDFHVAHGRSCGGVLSFFLVHCITLRLDEQSVELTAFVLSMDRTGEIFDCFVIKISITR